MAILDIITAMRFHPLLLSVLFCWCLCGKDALASETLTMDVWEPYAPEWAVADFKKFIKQKYNKEIKVVVNYVYSPNDFFDRVRGNETDIISPSHNLIHDDRFSFIQKKLVIPVNKKLLPHLKEVEDSFINNDFIVDKNLLYGVPFASGAYSLLYKKAYFKTAPDSWKILWDSRYRQQFAISKEFYESNIYITALSLGIPKDKIADVESLKSEAFSKRLKQLLKNATYWQGVPHDKEVEKSVLTTAWGFSHSVHDDPKKEWVFAFPKEGITMWTDYLLVTRAVKRSAFAETLAMEWLNFSLSPEFQRRLVIDQLKCYSAVPGAYVAEGYKPLTVAPKEKEFLFKNAIYWPTLSARNRNGMKLIYDRVEKEIQKEKAARK